MICLYDQRRVAAEELDRIAMAHLGSTLDQANGDQWPQLRLLHTADPLGLRIIGQADLATRDALAAVVAGLTKDLPVDDVPVTVDVSELGFADGAIARALVRAARTAPSGMRIVGASATLARLIHLAGGDDVPGLTLQAASSRNDAQSDHGSRKGAENQ